MVLFFFKQKTAYEMRISDWSSDVCSSDLWDRTGIALEYGGAYRLTYVDGIWRDAEKNGCGPAGRPVSRGDLRRLLPGGLRLRDQPRMALVGTVAHPRLWALREREWNLQIGRASCRERVCQSV